MNKSVSKRIPQFVATSFLALTLLLLGQAVPASAQEAVKFGLKPVGDSGVSGLATISAREGGKATVEMEVSALNPGGEYSALLLAGSCAMPSASFGNLGILKADSNGMASLSASSARFSAGGVVMDLDFLGLADGDHIIAIAGQGVVACGAIPAVVKSSPEQTGPQFRQGFKTLADYLPGIVGRPLEEEHYAANGDSLQQTTTGLMVWRKADNWTAFTDGSSTWINGPEGIQIRPNGERLAWEEGGRG